MEAEGPDDRYLDLVHLFRLGKNNRMNDGPKAETI
jgi:hypothetical protein